MSDLTQILARTPAKRIAEIPLPVLQALDDGLVPTKNLTEWLAVDRRHLLEKLSHQLCFERAYQQYDIWNEDLLKLSALKHSMAVGQFLSKICAVGDELWKKIASHTSDVVREWAAITIGLDDKLSFARKLAWMKPIADDAHSGLREIAWLALRPDVANDPEAAIRRLVPWTGSRNERLRRFASEITRPRGVWTTHIAILKEKPEIGLAILEPLCNDESRYVQNSVANWLNDASKSQPDWVRAVTRKWIETSPTTNTAWIVKRALRTVGNESRE